MSELARPRFSGLVERSREADCLHFARGSGIQFQPTRAFLTPEGQEISLAGVESLLLVKDTTQCSADDSTTHSFSLTFQSPQGDLLELVDEDRYGGWDRDLDALDGEVRLTAQHIATSLEVPLWIRRPGDPQPRLWQPPRSDREQALREAGSIEEALRVCEELLTNEPSSLPALRRKGDYLNQLGRHQAAADTYRTLLKHDSDDTSALLGLARSLGELGQATEAIAVLKAGIRSRPRLALQEALAPLLGMSSFDAAFEQVLDELRRPPYRAASTAAKDPLSQDEV